MKFGYLCVYRCYVEVMIDVLVFVFMKILFGWFEVYYSFVYLFMLCVVWLIVIVVFFIFVGWGIYCVKGCNSNDFD